jgi:uncharacterized protein
LIQDALMPAERTPHADDSLLAWPLKAMTEWTLRAPRTVLICAAALALLASAISIGGLTFKTNRLDLLNPRSEYNRRWLAYLAEFGSRDDAVIVVRAEQPADLQAAIDDVAAQLRAETQLFESVFYRRDLSALKAKALHYLPPDELTKLEGQLAAAAQLLPRADQPIDPAGQLAALNDWLAHIATTSPDQRAVIEKQYAIAAGTILAELSAGLPNPPSAVVPASAQMNLPPGVGNALATNLSLASLAQFEPQYLTADDGKLGFVLTRLAPSAGEPSAGSRAIARVREIIAHTLPKHPRAWIGLTGMPVIEYDEMQASQFDMLWTSIVSLGLVIVLYLAAYGGLRHAMLLNVVLVLATAYSFGFVTLAVGHLNILSSAFSAVLIGLGIDFAIHYVASYLKLRQDGCDAETALLRTAVDVGPGVVTGGVTTAAAFFMAAMTDFIGVRELGLVAGGGILLCVLSAVIIMPPLVLLVDERWPLTRVPTILPAGRWVELPLRWPRLTMGLTLLVTLLMGGGAVWLRYDHNLLNLQPRHLESADIERQLLAHLDDSVWFAVSVCPTRQELQSRKAAYEKLPIVSKTEEIASLLPSSPPEHAARIAALCRQFAALPEQPPAVAPVSLPRLKQEVARAQELLARETPYETPAGGLIARLGATLDAAPGTELERRLSQASTVALTSAVTQLSALRALADPVSPKLDDLPKELTDRFVGVNRTYLLKVYARGDIWNMRELESFVHAVESVDPQVTGHPVQTYYASRHMQESYLWAGLYAVGAVLVLLWIDFRSLWHSLLAMVPLAIGFVQMCGLIGWLDIPLNAANMIVLPLILGIGVDHGVHLVHLWRQQPGRFVLGDTTTTAVLLTATTTTASFGALILARHQGLQSLGQVLTLGVTTCLGSSILFFPALLTWLSEGRSREADVGRRGSEIRGQRTGARGQEPGARDRKHKMNDAQAGQLVPSTQYSVLSTSAEAAATIPSIPHYSLTPAAPPLPSDVPSEPAVQPPAASRPAQPQPIVPAPVTEEEIAALLESALTPHPLRGTETPGQPADDPTISSPRRRILPRRSEAA